MTHWLAIGLVLLLTGASLATASVLRDRGVAPPVTRWVAATVGGLAYLVAVLWLDTWSAVALSALSLLLIAVLRARRSSLLKGLRWSTNWTGGRCCGRTGAVYGSRTQAVVTRRTDALLKDVAAPG